eukprot:scaffold117969_cov19-Tisochrysis_lutea.AAC.5
MALLMMSILSHAGKPPVRRSNRWLKPLLTCADGLPPATKAINPSCRDKHIYQPGPSSDVTSWGGGSSACCCCSCTGGCSLGGLAVAAGASGFDHAPPARNSTPRTLRKGLPACSCELPSFSSACAYKA